MRVISFSVNARRFDSAVDLSSFTRTAGLTASNPAAPLHRDRFAALSRPSLQSSVKVLRFPDHENAQRRSLAAWKGRVRFRFIEKSDEAFNHAFVAPVSRFLRLDCFRFRHVSHRDLTDALGSDSTFAAVNTSLTPCAMTSRAASTLSLPFRALSAALCHARQISRACFLSRVFVYRTRACW